MGVEIGNTARAYDWNELKEKRIIHDKVGNTPIVIALSDDGQSFAAFSRNADNQVFEFRNDSLISEAMRYDFSGNGTNGASLDRVAAYQEFWHSWRTFRPHTERYQ